MRLTPLRTGRYKYMKANPSRADSDAIFKPLDLVTELPRLNQVALRHGAEDAYENGRQDEASDDCL